MSLSLAKTVLLSLSPASLPERQIERPWSPTFFFSMEEREQSICKISKHGNFFKKSYFKLQRGPKFWGTPWKLGGRGGIQKERIWLVCYLNESKCLSLYKRYETIRCRKKLEKLWIISLALSLQPIARLLYQVNRVQQSTEGCGGINLMVGSVIDIAWHFLLHISNYCVFWISHYLYNVNIHLCNSHSCWNPSSYFHGA